LRPGSGYQFLFADHLAGAVDERGQDVKGAAAEPHRLVALEQQPLRCKKPVRAKQYRLLVHRAGPGFTSFTCFYSTRQRQVPAAAQVELAAWLILTPSTRRVARPRDCQADL
jgi:hypothetical protein